MKNREFIKEVVEEAVDEMMVMDDVPELFKSKEDKDYAAKVFAEKLNKY